jgi:hypothetical protein
MKHHTLFIFTYMLPVVFAILLNFGFKRMTLSTSFQRFMGFSMQVKLQNNHLNMKNILKAKTIRN